MSMEKSFPARRKIIHRRLAVGIASPEINHTFIVNRVSARVPKE